MILKIVTESWTTLNREFAMSSLRFLERRLSCCLLGIGIGVFGLILFANKIDYSLAIC